LENTEKDIIQQEAGIMEITQLMKNVYHAGTNSKEELIELQNNMLSLLSDKRYSFKDIEHYLVSWGYQVPAIRRIYQNLTGLEPYRVNTSTYLLDVPGSLPGFNYGWGVGKGSKYQYVFVISYKSGFAVFGQIDDLKRELIEYNLSLEDCFITLEKEAKDIKTCREVTDINPKVLSERGQLPFSKETDPAVQQLTWLGRTSSLKQQIDRFGDSMQANEVRAMLRHAYNDQQITADEHKQLTAYYLSRKADETSLEKSLEETSINTDKNPDKVLDEANQNKNITDINKEIQNAFKKITEFLAENLVDLEGKFSVDVNKINYTKKTAGGATVEKTPDVQGQAPTQYFNKTGSYAVVLDLESTEFYDAGVQQALIVFDITDKGEVETNGMFKGTDDNKYALNIAGLEDYFKSMSTVTENE
jgi:hypothetical protein